VPNALKVKKILKQSWGQFLVNAFKMMSAEEGHNLLQLAHLASGAIRQQKAIYEGNEQEGVLFCGQVAGATHDLPSVRELINRIVAEAEEVLRKGANRVSS
jgi:nitronate monooxygenase